MHIKLIYLNYLMCVSLLKQIVIKHMKYHNSQMHFKNVNIKRHRCDLAVCIHLI
jgi:hypothetical protein